MAIGDRTPTELVAPQALTASAAAYFTNASASFRAQLTGIWLNNTGATQRTVILYKNGTTAANQLSQVVLPAGGSALIDLVGKPLVFTGTQALSAKQDVGTDVTIAAYGIIEQIA